MNNENRFISTTINNLPEKPISEETDHTDISDPEGSFEIVNKQSSSSSSSSEEPLPESPHIRKTLNLSGSSEETHVSSEEPLPESPHIRRNSKLSTSSDKPHVSSEEPVLESPHIRRNSKFSEESPEEPLSDDKDQERFSQSDDDSESSWSML